MFGFIRAIFRLNVVEYVYVYIHSIVLHILYGIAIYIHVWGFQSHLQAELRSVCVCVCVCVCVYIYIHVWGFQSHLQAELRSVCVCVCVYIYIYMFGVFRAICRLNLGVCVCVCMCIYILSQVQPADGSDKPKHVAKSCKFIKYLIKMLC